jgi:hypothetical protein
MTAEKGPNFMLERTRTISELVEIAKRNGDFKKNYGTII